MPLVQSASLKIGARIWPKIRHRSFFIGFVIWVRGMIQFFRIRYIRIGLYRLVVCILWQSFHPSRFHLGMANLFLLVASFQFVEVVVLRIFGLLQVI